jgi:hypothetical protein
MKKFSNKILLIALVTLVGIFVLSRVFRSSKLESNIRKELVKLDTAKVSEIRIQSTATEGEELKLVRAGNGWKVVAGDKEAKTEPGTVKSMLGVAMDLQAQRLVSRKKEKWETFEVGENSTRVTVFNGLDKLADFKIGKFGFLQSQGQPQGNGMQGMFTYVRLTNEDEVYSSEGFIGSHFNRSFDQWRDKTFLKVTQEINKIDFLYPDSSFVLEKRDSIWYAGQIVANESKVTQYLNKLKFKNVTEFEDGIIQPGGNPMKIQIEGPSGVIATAQAWAKSEEDFILASTFQEGVYFSGKRNGVVKEIFPGVDWFTNP